MAQLAIWETCSVHYTNIRRLRDADDNPKYSNMNEYLSNEFAGKQEELAEEMKRFPAHLRQGCQGCEGLPDFRALETVPEQTVGSIRKCGLYLWQVRLEC